MTRLKVGDKSYIVESIRWIREAEIRSTAGGMYLIKFTIYWDIAQLAEHPSYTRQVFRLESGCPDYY